MSTSSTQVRSIFTLSALILISCVALDGQDRSDPLKYAIQANPGNLLVDRMPGPRPPRSYQETFTFMVTNQARTDYAGSAPSCQTFDVEVTPVNTPDQSPIWMWSRGQVFCQTVTPVHIPAGKSWQETATWKFTTAEVKDGKYRATAIFIPTQSKVATIDFEITSGSTKQRKDRVGSR